MCAIAGCLSNRGGAWTFVRNALSVLSYRGYDSHGWANLSKTGKNPRIIRELGPFKTEQAIDEKDTQLSIGHLRWATHGKATLDNAHPVEAGRFWVVHNGVLANEVALRGGKAFPQKKTQTDTETIAQMFSWREADDDVTLEDDLDLIASEVEGDNAFLVAEKDRPGRLYFFSRGAPLLMAAGDDGEVYFASDEAAFVGFPVSAYLRLPDGFAGMADLSDGNLTVGMVDGRGYIQRMNWTFLGSKTTKDNKENPVSHHPYRCWMEKEIYEQAYLEWDIDWVSKLPSAGPVHLFGCGSSYHAALLGRHYWEKILGFTATATCSPDVLEFGLKDESEPYIALSQSGETHDTLASCKGICPDNLYAIVSRRGSTLAATANSKVGKLNCGQERGVAATKSFTCQVALLWAWAIQKNSLPEGLEEAIERVLAFDLSSQVGWVDSFSHVLFLGKGVMYPVALEAALKLKEVAYIHAEGMYSSEVKHGPLALIDEKTLCVFLLDDSDYQSVQANIRQVEARGGQVLCIAPEGKPGLVGCESCQVGLPEGAEGPWGYRESLLCWPILVSIYCQRLAMEVGLKRGLDVDMPRSLAKSVTV